MASRTTETTPKTKNGNNGFKPGQSGNPAGRPSVSFRDALLAKIPDKLDKLTNVLIDKAVKGDLRALETIMDRLDGKVPQSHEFTQTAPFLIEVGLAPEEPLEDDPE